MRLIPRSSNSGVAVRGRTAISRPTVRAASSPASAAKRSPASSAAAVAGGLGLIAPVVVLAAIFVGLPLVMLIAGAEPGATLMVMAMMVVAFAWCWWSEGRRQAAELRRMPKPRRSTSPCAEEFQRRWGTTERCAEPEKTVPDTLWMRLLKWAGRWGAPETETASAATAEPVPAFVVNELPGADGVYNARVYTVVDAFADTMAEAERLNLTRDEQIEALTAVLRGAKPYSSSKAKQLVRGGGGWGGQGRVRGGAQAIEAKAGRRWLGRY